MLFRSPKISDEIKIISKKRLLKYGVQDLLKDLDRETIESIDINNQMRVIRAWEVFKETGKSLKKWQNKTGTPILPLIKCQPLVINPNKNDLDKKIRARFKEMIKMGALDEARKNLDMWNQGLIASKAIGASELSSYLKNEISLDEAITNASIATRQYAKRQRTWIKARMKHWDDVTELID